MLQIDDARIIYRNFSGAPSKFNREGDRNFAVVIPDQETADILIDDGWNVKIKPPREDGDMPFMYLPVKIKYNDDGRGPTAYLKSGRAMNRLTEETICTLDDVDILSVDMDLRPYDWDINGKVGRTAYLQSIHVTQEVDRFAERYAAENEDDVF
jgi:hypothetical protein